MADLLQISHIDLHVGNSVREVVVFGGTSRKWGTSWRCRPRAYLSCVAPHAFVPTSAGRERATQPPLPVLADAGAWLHCGGKGAAASSARQPRLRAEAGHLLRTVGGVGMTDLLQINHVDLHVGNGVRKVVVFGVLVA